MMTRRRFFAFGAAAVGLSRYPVFAETNDLRAIAYLAYLYVLPLLEMAATRERLISKGASQNVLYARRDLADPSSRSVTTPNNDTLYSSAWMDLSVGSVSFALPHFGRRYFSLSLMDMYTNNFAVLGTRATGEAGGTFKIVGPSDAIAAGERDVVRSPTPHGWALARILVDGPDDLEAARAAQAAITLTAPRVDSISHPGAIAAVAPDAKWQAIFAEANALLALDRPPVTDRAILLKIAPLGVGPDATFRPEAFGNADRDAIAAGVAAARALVTDTRNRRVPVQGWYYPPATLGAFGQDYVTRAVVSRTGLAALPREEAMYVRPVGERGDAIYDGGKMWRIHFAPGQLPPVSGFWSLSMYERTREGQSFFTENPLKRYAIGDRTPGLKTNDDGSLDLWIGHRDPGEERRANWLPAPLGPFTMTLRAYLPESTFLNGDYRLPPVTAAE
jgi:hypothetical protein